jgi:YegS/Rv2252/BmrU family lipid kinase
LKNFLIYNPAAGKLLRRPDWVPAILKRFQARNVAIEPRPTTGPGVAMDLARECAQQPGATVYVAGGDGTINEVVNGLAGKETPLGILPGGTANCLAVEIGIGTDPVQAAAQAGNWKPHRIPLGRCQLAGGESRYFIAMAGAGVDAQIVRDVDTRVKKRLGKLAYWLAGFGATWRVLPELKVSTPLGEAQASFALASRVRNYGGDLEIAKSIRLPEPYFEIVLFEGRFAVKYLKYLAGVLLNQHQGMKGVHVEKVDHLELAPANGDRVYLQLDGEEFGELPARLEIVPQALTLLAPPQ